MPHCRRFLLFQWRVSSRFRVRNTWVFRDLNGLVTRGSWIAPPPPSLFPCCGSLDTIPPLSTLINQLIKLVDRLTICVREERTRDARRSREYEILYSKSNVQLRFTALPFQTSNVSTLINANYTRISNGSLAGIQHEIANDRCTPFVRLHTVSAPSSERGKSKLLSLLQFPRCQRDYYLSDTG